MTPGYKNRRAEKQAADAVRRKTLKAAQAALKDDPLNLQMVNLLAKGPRLSWLGGKMFKRSDGGEANSPGRLNEQAEAVEENLVHSIGGINEDLGLPNDDADPLSD